MARKGDPNSSMTQWGNIVFSAGEDEFSTFVFLSFPDFKIGYEALTYLHGWKDISFAIVKEGGLVRFILYNKAGDTYRLTTDKTVLLRPDVKEFVDSRPTNKPFMFSYCIIDNEPLMPNPEDFNGKLCQGYIHTDMKYFRFQYIVDRN